MKAVLLRLAGFTGLPLLSIVTPFLLIPIVARVAGAEGWSSVAAGQSAGAFGGAVIAWGWNTLGPVEIAQNPAPQHRAEVYRESIRTRLVLSAAVAPFVFVLAWSLAAPEHRLDAAAMSMTTTVAGMSPAWFCIGAGKPTLLALFDTLPRVVATVIAVPVILMTSQIWLYAAILIVAVIASLMVFHRIAVPERGKTFASWRGTFQHLRGHFGPAAISLSGTTYAATPLPIGQAFVPNTVMAGFSSADTVYRFGLFSVMALGNTFQGWTLELQEASPRKRHAAAIVSHFVLGLAGAAFLTLLGPLATTLIFGADKSASMATCAFYGLSFLFISASTPFIRNLLLPQGRQRLILVWTLISAIVGVTLMFVAATRGWADGIALSMALSEAILFLGLLIPGLRLWQKA
ncbi:polysaccharide biosynthesis protein [Pseudarthrobacter chlorophenolicus A6]|uniref:Polysaccharide biosynthesis protein n=1 Tax=Pseudarthrobacter chlorophenolicus (strain ATCC 700700 / DSM 12829 / CIP 107037 / JCM 12360 / KCTC 9906 / NCIMB 13794 / A6) TaxID=452863 RepID=B8HBJ6_PSECP|nr:polysaccharide biosynthesis protein [Pseudarthrobacter chlorophenolicus]ACL40384.1 polysaccharide biosynthesis protein [Pseudarthrobacter chlorophenolicus A6]SDQ82562.1 Membrane protein involved in the export of O-antigen and teichoic acid [Pseudarthrobacter chlorophenolicus]